MAKNEVGFGETPRYNQISKIIFTPIILASFFAAMAKNEVGVRGQSPVYQSDSCK